MEMNHTKITIIIIIIIIIINKKRKTCALIDVAIPADRNVVQKEAEIKLKYKRLCIEIHLLWILKCTIIPLIIGATGTVRKEKLEAIPGKKHSIGSLQKTAVLGTAHIILRLLWTSPSHLYCFTSLSNL